MAKSTADSFWIIYDTCTRPEYYQDVHNILALPHGCVVRYDYKNDLLSSTAKRFSDEPDEAPDKVLLAYGQYEGYEQGGNEKSLQSNPMSWIATRCARLVHIEQEGDNYHYDLELGNYPSYQPEVINRVIENVERPFDKWVVVSTATADLSVLEQSHATDENWANIVKWFHSNSQFSKDVFWRISAPVRRNSSRQIKPKLLRTSGKASTVFPVRDDDRLFLRFTARESDSTPNPSREIRLETDAQFITVETTQISMRHYYQTDVNLSVNAQGVLQVGNSVLKIKTLPQTGDFPIGPNLVITFALRRNLLRILVGCLAGLIAVVCTFTGTNFNSLDPYVRVPLVVAGAVGIAVFSWVVRKDLKFKA